LLNWTLQPIAFFFLPDSTMSSSDESMLHTPVMEMESPESKIARLEVDLRAKDTALRAKDTALRAKDAVLEEEKKANKQLRDEMACMKLADKLKETLSLTTTGNEDHKQLARQIAENIDEAKDYVCF